MILQSAKLVVTDADIAKAVAKQYGRITGPVVKIKEDGIYVLGQYDTGIPVFKVIGFETLWVPLFQGNDLTLSLKDIKVTGLGINLGWFKSQIFDQIALAFKGMTRLTFVNETIVVSVTNTYVDVKFTAILLENGQLTVVAGS